MFSFSTHKKRKKKEQQLPTLSAIERLYPPPPQHDSKRKRFHHNHTNNTNKHQTSLNNFFIKASSIPNNNKNNQNNDTTKKKNPRDQNNLSLKHKSSTLSNLLLTNHHHPTKEVIQTQNDNLLQTTTTTTNNNKEEEEACLDQMLNSVSHQLCQPNKKEIQTQQQTTILSIQKQNWKRQQPFLYQQNYHPSSSSLVWQLHHRQIFGNYKHSHNNLTPTTTSTTVTSIPNSYRVLHHVTFSSIQQQQIITNCTWNEVHDDLLAVVTIKGTIFIYDVHDITLAAAKKRILQKTKTIDILPVLEFQSTEKYISICKWNPNDPNELFIGYEHSNEIHVYNVEDEDVSNSRMVYQRTSDDIKEGTCSLIIGMSTITNGSGGCPIYIGGKNGTLTCYLHPNRKKKWTIQVWNNKNEGISTLLLFQQQTCLLVGGTNGSLAVYDVLHLKRKSFSTQATPILLQTYSLPNLLQRIHQQTKQDDKHCHPDWKPSMETTLLKQPSIASIQSIYFCYHHKPTQTKNPKRKQDNQINNMVVLPPFIIVTSCGWVWLLSNLTIQNNGKQRQKQKNNVSLQLCRQSNRIQYVEQEKSDTNEGEQDKFHPYLYSMPIIPTPSCQMMNQWYCVANVPSTYQIMPSDKKSSDDKTINTNNVVFTKSDEMPSIRIAKNGTNKMCDIELPVSIKSKQNYPRSIAMHPHEQWMVVSTGSQLHLLQQGL